jgi:hypothetical protein
VYQEFSLGVKGGRRVRRKPHRHLQADFLDNVTASTSHSPVGFHGLLQAQLYVYYVPQKSVEFMRMLSIQNIPNRECNYETVRHMSESTRNVCVTGNERTECKNGTFTVYREFYLACRFLFVVLYKTGYKFK